MALESGDRILEFTAERVGHVTNSGGAVGQPLELLRRYPRRNHHPNMAESEPFKLTGRLNRQIGELSSVFFGDVSDREREARRDRGEQHLRRPRSGVGAADLNWFIDEQLEVPHVDAAFVLAIPGGGNGPHG